MENPLARFHTGIQIHEVEHVVPWHTTREEFSTLIPNEIVTRQNQHWITLNCTIFNVQDEFAFNFIPAPGLNIEANVKLQPRARRPCLTWKVNCVNRLISLVLLLTRPGHAPFPLQIWQVLGLGTGASPCLHLVENHVFASSDNSRACCNLTRSCSRNPSINTCQLFSRNWV